MQVSHIHFGIFAKEWRSKRLILCVIYGAFLLALAYVIGEYDPSRIFFGHLILLASIIAVSILILGIGILSTEERDPSRSLLYQLPISRARLLTIKLLALASQVLPLIVIFDLTLTVMTRLNWIELCPTYNPSPSLVQSAITLFRLLTYIPAVIAFLSAIIALHIRSAIVAIVLSAIIASGIYLLFYVPCRLALDPSSSISQMNVPTQLAITALLLLGWLYFLFCRTRIQELTPTPRSLLSLVFTLGLFEVVFAIVYTGWDDLAYMIFGV